VWKRVERWVSLADSRGGLYLHTRELIFLSSCSIDMKLKFYYLYSVCFMFLAFHTRSFFSKILRKNYYYYYYRVFWTEIIRVVSHNSFCSSTTYVCRCSGTFISCFTN